MSVTHVSVTEINYHYFISICWKICACNVHVDISSQCEFKMSLSNKNLETLVCSHVIGRLSCQECTMWKLPILTGSTVRRLCRQKKGQLSSRWHFSNGFIFLETELKLACDDTDIWYGGFMLFLSKLVIVLVCLWSVMFIIKCLQHVTSQLYPKNKAQVTNTEQRLM